MTPCTAAKAAGGDGGVGCLLEFAENINSSAHYQLGIAQI
jgi:hypothetical protein